MKVENRINTSKPWEKARGMSKGVATRQAMEEKARTAPKAYKRIGLSPALPHSKTYGR